MDKGQDMEEKKKWVSSLYMDRLRCNGMINPCSNGLLLAEEKIFYSIAADFRYLSERILRILYMRMYCIPGIPNGKSDLG